MRATQPQPPTPAIPLLGDLTSEQLRAVIATATGLLAHREGVLHAASVCHRVGTKIAALPTGGIQ